MDMIKQKFLTTFTTYILDNKLNFGFCQHGNIIDKSIIHLKDQNSLIRPIANIADINIEGIIFESEKPVVFDFNAIKNYVKEVLVSDEDLATYILGLSKFGDRFTLLKEFSKNEKVYLKILGQSNIYQEESLKLKHLNTIFSTLSQYSSDYENELQSFVRVNRSVFKNPELLAVLLSFLEDNSHLNQEYFTTLLKVKNQELFLENDNQAFSLRINKTQLYANISFDNNINKDNYWKMLKNIQSFYNSKESKAKGIEYAIIDNYSNSYSYFRLTLETNGKNILDKTEIESLTYELFASFATSILNRKTTTISDLLSKEQIKSYQNIFAAFILNKKIPNKVATIQKLKI